MFTASCFIRKNTPELISKLIDLGYVKALSDEEYTESEVYGLIVDQGDIVPLEHPLQEDELIFTYNFIDCDDNEELLIALAALRDDSDYMQWFVSPKTHTKRIPGCFGQVIGMDGHYKEIVGYEWHRHENKDNALTERLNSMIQMEAEDMTFLPHKATAEEIVEHFKKEENMETKLVKDLKKNDKVYCVFDGGETYILEVGEIYEHEHYNTIVFNRRNNGNSYTFDAGKLQCWICDEIDSVPIFIYLTKDDAIEALRDTIEKCKESIEMLS